LTRLVGESLAAWLCAVGGVRFCRMLWRSKGKSVRVTCRVDRPKRKKRKTPEDDDDYVPDSEHGESPDVEEKGEAPQGQLTPKRQRRQPTRTRKQSARDKRQQKKKESAEFKASIALRAEAWHSKRVSMESLELLCPLTDAQIKDLPGFAGTEEKAEGCDWGCCTARCVLCLAFFSSFETGPRTLWVASGQKVTPKRSYLLSPHKNTQVNVTAKYHPACCRTKKINSGAKNTFGGWAQYETAQEVRATRACPCVIRPGMALGSWRSATFRTC